MAANATGNHNPKANTKKDSPNANRNEKKATITKEPTTIFTTSFVSQQSATKATIEVVKNKNGLNINPTRKLIAIGIGDK